MVSAKSMRLFCLPSLIYIMLAYCYAMSDEPRQTRVYSRRNSLKLNLSGNSLKVSKVSADDFRNCNFDFKIFRKLQLYSNKHILFSTQTDQLVVKGAMILYFNTVDQINESRTDSLWIIIKKSSYFRSTKNSLSNLVFQYDNFQPSFRIKTTDLILKIRF